MSPHRPSLRAGWRPRLALGLMSLVATLVSAPAARAAQAKGYIVQLKAPPLAAYAGGAAGLPATSPKVTGQAKVNVQSSAAVQYSAYLASTQRAALGRLPGTPPRITYSYRTAFAGFAAELTQPQLAALRHAPEVARIWPDGKAQIQSTPDPGNASQVNAALDGLTGFPDSAAYLGLPTGIWSELGEANHAGDGVVVGVVDTGITPQHPSFADTPAGNYVGPAYGPPPATFRGTCDPGQDPLDFRCNDKLVGARYFVAGFGLSHLAAGSFVSPRDDDGHGTHTASTAAGNFGVDPAIEGSDLGVDLISGIAPRARVAAYKVCWSGGDVADGCTESDSVAGIDQAVADGVDVINYSVGGPEPFVIGAVEYAFLGASDAGVFVSNSAGNDGPGASTVGSPAAVPWLTAVAAENPARTFAATATIHPPSGPAFPITGASVTPGLATPTQVVDAASSGAAGVAAGAAELCKPGALDPAKVAGRIVLCLRGDNARIDKSLNVKRAGGAGMILYNPTPNQDLDTDIHWVPSVHVANADGLKVKAAVAAGTTTATLGAGRAAHGTPRVLGAFSSRGPQTAVPDIAKPDVTAPGVNILAGNSPNPTPSSGLPPGQLFQSISGTSMAAPHVAGAGALLRQARPDWSPAEIKSALMLTANPSVLAEDGVTPATPFDAGSGEIDPTRAAHPGLVLDVSTNDYIRYVDSQDPSIFGDTQAPIAPTDLNLASIAAASVPGALSTTRAFTSVDPATRTWTAHLAVPGFSGAATAPGGSSTFQIQPGATQTLKISLRRTSAPLGTYVFGALTLTSGQTTLRVPVSLRPIPIRAPATVAIRADTPAGTATIPVQAGYTGTLTALGWGLAPPALRTRQTIQTDPVGAPDPESQSASNRFYDVQVPAGAQILSGRILNADGDADPNTDLDLYLYRDANGDGRFTPDELVDASASAIADEKVTEVLPQPGRYRFVVVGFATRSPSTFDFGTWLVDDQRPDQRSEVATIALTGDPFAVTPGQTVTPTVAYAGLHAHGLYLGLATFHDSAQPSLANVRATTVVEITKTNDSVR